jgi:tRNA-dependent cyclodipeptide synthase
MSKFLTAEQTLKHPTGKGDVAKGDESLKKSFSAQICWSETSGPEIERFLQGQLSSVILGISPTSATSNRARLKAILHWLLKQVSRVTVVDGCWFHRWDLVAFKGTPLDTAATQSLAEMGRLHRRIRSIAAELGASDRVAIVSWPETDSLPEVAAIRADARTAALNDQKLTAAINEAVESYLAGMTEANHRSSIQPDVEALKNYVFEEIGTLVYLASKVSPVEVYPGPDLPLLRRIAAGEFRDSFPHDISNRSHLSLELIEVSVGYLREGRESDWPEIERLLRAWPTHFVEAAIPLAREEFLQHKTLLCDGGNGKVLGFMTWRTDGQEMELLWMAVDPAHAREGVCTSVVKAVLCQRRRERRIFGRTATLDSTIPGTQFSGQAYEPTYRFFERFGFKFTTRHEGYWSPTNHMIVLEKFYDH